jgi:hypothetical protein
LNLPSNAAADLEAVTRLLGRAPAGEYTIVLRRPDGQAMVIANHPLLRDGTPMPTRYWLVDPEVRAQIAKLEAEGGVKRAQHAVSAAELERAHRNYAKERDALIPTEWTGPRPSGGVGGTRQGVKCLHAHVAWWFAGGDDPVGAWVSEQIGLRRPEST